MAERTAGTLSLPSSIQSAGRSARTAAQRRSDVQKYIKRTSRLTLINPLVLESSAKAFALFGWDGPIWGEEFIVTVEVDIVRFQASVANLVYRDKNEDAEEDNQIVELTLDGLEKTTFVLTTASQLGGVAVYLFSSVQYGEIQVSFST